MISVSIFSRFNTPSPLQKVTKPRKKVMMRPHSVVPRGGCFSPPPPTLITAANEIGLSFKDTGRQIISLLGLNVGSVEEHSHMWCSACGDGGIRRERRERRFKEGGGEGGGRRGEFLGRLSKGLYVFRGAQFRR